LELGGRAVAWTEQIINENPSGACSAFTDSKAQTKCNAAVKSFNWLSSLGYTPPADSNKRFEAYSGVVEAFRDTKLITDPRELLCVWPACRKLADVTTGDQFSVYNKSVDGTFYNVLSSNGEVGYIRADAVSPVGAVTPSQPEHVRQSYSTYDEDDPCKYAPAWIDEYGVRHGEGMTPDECRAYDQAASPSPTPSYPGSAPSPSYPGSAPSPSYPGSAPSPSYPGSAPTPSISQAGMAAGSVAPILLAVGGAFVAVSILQGMKK